MRIQRKETLHHSVLAGPLWSDSVQARHTQHFSNHVYVLQKASCMLTVLTTESLTCCEWNSRSVFFFQNIPPVRTCTESVEEFFFLTKPIKSNNCRAGFSCIYFAQIHSVASTWRIRCEMILFQNNCLGTFILPFIVGSVIISWPRHWVSTKIYTTCQGPD